ncbi:MAG: DJ-1/PfpI family protein [Saprospiraceae bacterium]|nr:DJ-1/PfpI family protein [Saprospiraceae bacterium]
MKKPIFLFFISIYLFIPIAKAQTKFEDSIIYRCPPCEIFCDSINFDKAGICPHCGMKLYPTFKSMPFLKTPLEENQFATNKTVAILLFKGVEIIDFTGPYEVFGAAGMNVVTVAEYDTLITTFMGMKVKPDYTFDNLPKVDIVVLPGGGVNRNNQRIKEWLLKIDKTTEYTMSVCNGAFYLAAAGLLDGQESTTFYGVIPSLQEFAPKTKVVTNKRFVDNGHIITSAGLSSGIDAALHLVSKYVGKGRAQEIATQLEYNWDETYVRAALADKYLETVRSVFTPFEKKTLQYEGNRMRWTYKLDINSDFSTEKIKSLIDNVCLTNKEFKRIKQLKNGSHWRIKMDNGKLGILKTIIEPKSNQGFIATISIEMI